jgi:hypothetical protein
MLYTNASVAERLLYAVHKNFRCGTLVVFSQVLYQTAAAAAKTYGFRLRSRFAASPVKLRLTRRRRVKVFHSVEVGNR